MEMNVVFDWLPDSEDRLREMLDQGLLFERHTVDFSASWTTERAPTRSTPVTWPSSQSMVAC
jgi:hypothetical protein